MLAIRQIVINQCRFSSSKSISPFNATAPWALTSNPTNKPLKNNQLGFTNDGGEKYLGFTYYPRFPGKDDPPYEPTRVLMVQRIRSLKKKPRWDKELLAELGLGGINSNLAFIANTPNNCHKLWKVKHLVRITPVTIPQGLPEDGDFSGAQIQDNGVLKFVPKLKNDAKNSPILLQPQDKKDFLDGETLKKELRLQWLKPF
nr:EOG090X0EYV [Chydorus sphaericus]